MNKISILLIGSLLFAASSQAGVYRHDRKKQQYIDLGAKKEFDCVGMINKNDSRIGSCVLVGKKYVLSAAHVFKVSEIRLDTSYVGKSQIVVYQPINERIGNSKEYSFTFRGKTYAAQSISIYPTYMDSATKGMGDLALIELDRPVEDVQPAAMGKVFDELNANVTGVGYGAFGSGDKLESLDTTLLKIGGENVIDSIGGYEIGNTASVLHADFDHPTNKQCNKMGSAQPRNLEYACAGGDSGGGLFIETTKGYRLIGICSGTGYDMQQFQKTAYYGQTMSWTRVAVFYDWVKGKMK